MFVNKDFQTSFYKEEQLLPIIVSSNQRVVLRTNSECSLGFPCVTASLRFWISTSFKNLTKPQSTPSLPLSLSLSLSLSLCLHDIHLWDFVFTLEERDSSTIRKWRHVFALFLFLWWSRNENIFYLRSRNRNLIVCPGKYGKVISFVADGWFFFPEIWELGIFLSLLKRQEICCSLGRNVWVVTDFKESGIS